MPLADLAGTGETPEPCGHSPANKAAAGLHLSKAKWSYISLCHPNKEVQTLALPSTGKQAEVSLTVVQVVGLNDLLSSQKYWSIQSGGDTEQRSQALKES